jgi:hypothetical protein
MYAPPGGPHCAGVLAIPGALRRPRSASRWMGVTRTISTRRAAVRGWRRSRVERRLDRHHEVQPLPAVVWQSCQPFRGGQSRSSSAAWPHVRLGAPYRGTDPPTFPGVPTPYEARPRGPVGPARGVVSVVTLPKRIYRISPVNRATAALTSFAGSNKLVSRAPENHGGTPGSRRVRRKP